MVFIVQGGDNAGTIVHLQDVCLFRMLHRLLLLSDGSSCAEQSMCKGVCRQQYSTGFVWWGTRMVLLVVVVA